MVDEIVRCFAAIHRSLSGLLKGLGQVALILVCRARKREGVRRALDEAPPDRKGPWARSVVGSRARAFFSPRARPRPQGARAGFGAVSSRIVRIAVIKIDDRAGSS